MLELFEKKDLTSCNLSKEDYERNILRLQELENKSVKKSLKDYRSLSKVSVSDVSFGDTKVKKLMKKGTNLLYLKQSELLMRYEKHIYLLVMVVETSFEMRQAKSTLT